MKLSSASVYLALAIMILNSDFTKTWRWVQPTIVILCVGGMFVSAMEHAWLIGGIYLVAGMLALRRSVRDKSD